MRMSFGSAVISGIHVLMALAALAASPSSAAAPGTAELVRLINDYRAAPGMCEGRRTRPAGPLATEPALARVSHTDGEPLRDALMDAGYHAARAYAIVLSGPRTADAAMSLLRRRHCRILASPEYTEIGISRTGNAWHLVLARPLVSRDLGDWREAGKEILDLVNAARAEPRTCGGRRFAAAPPLAWNERLGMAALAHSRDMAESQYLDHAAPDGSLPGDRATRAGYRWRRIAENIASGQGSPREVVSKWLASPEHCENIMDRAYADMGAAYAIDPKRGSIYWSQLFGSTR
jgi:uncharacterized protein YkwD